MNLPLAPPFFFLSMTFSTLTNKNGVKGSFASGSPPLGSCLLFSAPPCVHRYLVAMRARDTEWAASGGTQPVPVGINRPCLADWLLCLFFDQEPINRDPVDGGGDRTCVCIVLKGQRENKGARYRI